MKFTYHLDEIANRLKTDGYCWYVLNHPQSLQKAKSVIYENTIQSINSPTIQGRPPLSTFRFGNEVVTTVFADGWVDALYPDVSDASFVAQEMERIHPENLCMLVLLTGMVEMKSPLGTCHWLSHSDAVLLVNPRHFKIRVVSVKPFDSKFLFTVLSKKDGCSKNCRCQLARNSLVLQGTYPVPPCPTINNHAFDINPVRFKDPQDVWRCVDLFKYKMVSGDMPLEDCIRILHREGIFRFSILPELPRYLPTRELNDPLPLALVNQKAIQIIGFEHLTVEHEKCICYMTIQIGDTFERVPIELSYGTTPVSNCDELRDSIPDVTYLDVTQLDLPDINPLLIKDILATGVKRYTPLISKIQNSQQIKQDIQKTASRMCEISEIPLVELGVQPREFVVLSDTEREDILLSFCEKLEEKHFFRIRQLDSKELRSDDSSINLYHFFELQFRVKPDLISKRALAITRIKKVDFKNLLKFALYRGMRSAIDFELFLVFYTIDILPLEALRWHLRHRQKKQRKNESFWNIA